MAGRLDLALAARVSGFLEEHEVLHALIGAGALALHGISRSTFDVDFLATDLRTLILPWAPALPEGTKIDVRRGHYDDPLAGVVRIVTPTNSQVDVVLGRWKWEASVFTRAGRLNLAGRSVPVASIPDLVLLKISAGGQLDLRDASLLMQTDPDGVSAAVRELANLVPERLRREVETFLDEHHGRSA